MLRPMNLIFDADDTLWECNVLFEQAIEEFVDYVGHPALSRAQIRAVLTGIERENSARYGYGARVFERSLGDCLARLRPGGRVDDADRAYLHGLCRRIVEGEIILLEGVLETLHALRDRHPLYLLTKGDPEHQQLKIDGSGLASLFDGIGIVPEKEPQAYRDFGRTHGLDPEHTWMIGNSVKSDVLPALEAGMGAVLVPHPATWVLEHAEPPASHDRYREVTPIGRLVEVF
ncbi:HAD family hydrolase [Streptomonospora litoralis]|uniref:Haloacid dehalogenase-like hydrolase n=1 Tax=Streptomonospora litoralis TaxID=2498135 RepID=A0A4P6PYH8_9ACTN|nr:HAD family hydrolase [Streptomonospora litoralis]QBI53215.1 haloacid dehalogenase-like hydrolase [Streptomonospora litoralis]